MPSETDAPNYNQEILIALDSIAAALGRILRQLVANAELLDNIVYSIENS